MGDDHHVHIDVTPRMLAREVISQQSWSLWPLAWNIVFSIIAYFVTKNIIPKFLDMFVQAGFFGIDMSKRDKVKVAEAMGVISGTVFLVTMFLFIPLPFAWHLRSIGDAATHVAFPHHQFVEFITAILCICCMLFLGFADDALNLRWRDKLFLPTIATLPLLMVYYVNSNSTTIIIPKPLRALIGFSVNLSAIYYVFMGMLAVFCTNAINILAGINGLEAGQSLIIAISVAIFNFIELTGSFRQVSLFSLYFLLPYIATTAGLLHHNWYPSRVFVGDTFCYFSGMTFAVVAILGHFSKTLLLFFIPQIFNFIFSVPQLFRLIPCPRHRLPRYNPDTNLLEFSTTKFKLAEVNIVGKLALRIFVLVGLVKVEESDEFVECNNFTLINLLLKFFGPMHERRLTCFLLIIQVLCSFVAFGIRYPGARLFYDV